MVGLSDDNSCYCRRIMFIENVSGGGRKRKGSESWNDKMNQLMREKEKQAVVMKRREGNLLKK